MKKLLIIGMGQIGTANAHYLSSLEERNLQVTGYDINPEPLKKALEQKIIAKAIDHPEFQGYDYYMICVSTHNRSDMTLPDLTALHHVMQSIREQAKPGALVCLESTMPPKTTKTLFEQHYREDIHIVHVPERFYAQEQKEHGIQQKRVFGYHKECCKEPGLRLYKDLMKIPLHIVDSIELAEASKVVENTYRYLQIAFVEELYLWANRLGINPDKLREACNTKWNIHLMEARNGIGLHCLPKESKMYVDAVEGLPSMIKSAREINDIYVKSLVTPQIRQ